MAKDRIPLFRFSAQKKKTRPLTSYERKALAAIVERNKSGAPRITLEELVVYRRLRELGFVTIQILCSPTEKAFK